MSLPRILLFSLVASGASAAPIVFQFTATVTQVDAQLTSAFTPGQTLTGSYRFESTTMDSAADPATGLYFGTGTLFTVLAGGSAFTASSVDIDITNTAPVDIYRVVGSGVSGPSLGGLPVSSLVLALTDNSAPVNALSTDALPLSPPSLANFNVRLLTLVFSQGANAASVVAEVNMLTTAVTEPALAAPLLLLLIGLDFSRRSHGRASRR